MHNCSVAAGYAVGEVVGICVTQGGCFQNTYTSRNSGYSLALHKAALPNVITTYTCWLHQVGEVQRFSLAHCTLMPWYFTYFLQSTFLLEDVSEAHLKLASHYVLF